MLSKLGCLRRFAASPLPKSQLNRTKESVHIVYNSTVELRGISTMFAVFLSLTLLLPSRCVTATLSASNAGPVVQLGYGSFQGNATADLEEFLGIPYAAPPYASYSNFACAYTDNFVLFVKSIGNLRFAHPELPLTFDGVRQTTEFGPACPQQAMDLSSVPGLGSRFPNVPPSSEDCNTVIYTYYLILF